MISKERLEELIKQEATIWAIGRYSFQDEIEEIKLDRDLFCVEYNALLYPDLFRVRLEDLFETKNRAKWALKYHATRTEELDLPMWEELDGADFDMSFIDTRKIKHQIWVTNDDGICVTNPQLDGKNKYWSYSEENYIKACDLCLKLFKGEENGN